MALAPEMQNLRAEFLTGYARNSKFTKPVEETWYAANMTPLLEANYDLQGDAALNDVEQMISTGDRTMKGKKERKKYEKKSCGPVALRLIKEWYENKQAAGG